MKLPIYKHEDNRRTLIEWIADFPIRMCKVLIVKEDSELGNHYHNNKIDNFFLLRGEGEYKFGDSDWIPLHQDDCLRADAGVAHTFRLKAGSVLLEASSTPYVKEDEIQIC